ncbi:hypothetical protein D3C85_1547630 [compost metagenome]
MHAERLTGVLKGLGGFFLLEVENVSSLLLYTRNPVRRTVVESVNAALGVVASSLVECLVRRSGLQELQTTVNIIGDPLLKLGEIGVWYDEGIRGRN